LPETRPPPGWPWYAALLLAAALVVAGATSCGLTPTGARDYLEPAAFAAAVADHLGGSLAGPVTSAVHGGLEGALDRLAQIEADRAAAGQPAGGSLGLEEWLAILGSTATGVLGLHGYRNRTRKKALAAAQD